MTGRGGPLRELVERSLGLVPGAPPPTPGPRSRIASDKARPDKSLH
jgi:hypothetical protein